MLNASGAGRQSSASGSSPAMSFSSTARWWCSSRRSGRGAERLTRLLRQRAKELLCRIAVEEIAGTQVVQMLHARGDAIARVDHGDAHPSRAGLAHDLAAVGGGPDHDKRPGREVRREALVEDAAAARTHEGHAHLAELVVDVVAHHRADLAASVQVGDDSLRIGGNRREGLDVELAEAA